MTRANTCSNVTRSILSGAVAAVLAVTVTACKSSGTPKAGAQPPRGATATTAPPTGTPAATPSGVSGSTKTTLDPCELVTQQEASALTGAAFGPGKEESDPGGGRRCVYGYQTKNVFLVVVVQAPTVELARAVKDQVRAEAQ